jgi:hypothetical protein
MTVSVPTRRNRQIVRSGPYQRDTELRRLVRAGTEAPPPPKPIALLVLRLQRAGMLVPKGEIVRQVRGSGVVGDSSVFQTARSVRNTSVTGDEAAGFCGPTYTIVRTRSRKRARSPRSVCRTRVTIAGSSLV